MRVTLKYKASMWMGNRTAILDDELSFANASYAMMFLMNRNAHHRPYTLSDDNGVIATGGRPEGKSCKGCGTQVEEMDYCFDCSMGI